MDSSKPQAGDTPPSENSTTLNSSSSSSASISSLSSSSTPLPQVKICIVGAGVAGLYTAMLLEFLAIPDLQYEIFESSNRVGGRIYTHHFSKDRHQYFDVGAMRYPRIPAMHRTFDLFKRIGISDKERKYYHDFVDGVRNTPEYYNDILHIVNTPDVRASEKDHRSIDYFLTIISPSSSGSALSSLSINSSLISSQITTPSSSYPATPANFEENEDTFKISRASGGLVPRAHVAIGAEEIIERIYRPYKEALDENFCQGWQILKQVEGLPARAVLRFCSRHRYDFDTIQWLDTMTVATNTLDQGITDNLLDNYFSSVPDKIPGHDDRWVCLEGGSEIIIEGMLKAIRAKPQLNSRITAISIDRTAAADNLGMLVQVKGEDDPRKYSTVFNTTTLACAQRMDLRGAELSPTQKEALRSLKYDCSCKIGIRFKTNWWAKGGIIGGAAATDLPIRVCVYPSYNIEDDWDQPAVLLCSYTWSQDAQRLASIIGPHGQGKTDELLELCVKNLALLHSNIIDEEGIRGQILEYFAYDWNSDPNMSGSVAMFAPGQFRRLYPSLIRPCANGNLHFVGEATSTAHAWVVGSLNSAWRGVYDFLLKYREQEYDMRDYWQGRIDALIGEFGKPDEVDIVWETTP